MSKENKVYQTIIYNGATPKFLRVNFSFLSKAIFILPLLATTIITGLSIYIFALDNKIKVMKSSQPAFIKNLQNKNQVLEQKYNAIELENFALKRKIAKGGTPNYVEFLSLVQKPLAMGDHRFKKLIELESPLIKTENNTIYFSFNIRNTSEAQESKIAGYASVIQIQGSTLTYYPQYKMDANALYLHYDKGERFTVSKFRPLIASFPKLSSSPVLYKVIIFDREGNLMLYKEFGPFNTDKNE